MNKKILSQNDIEICKTGELEDMAKASNQKSILIIELDQKKCSKYIDKGLDPIDMLGQSCGRLLLSTIQNCEMKETFLDRLFCPHCNNSNHDPEILKGLNAANGNFNFRCDACDKIFGVLVTRPVLFTPYKVGK